jgi:hypothetical protein
MLRKLLLVLASSVLVLTFGCKTTASNQSVVKGDEDTNSVESITNGQTYEFNCYCYKNDRECQDGQKSVGHIVLTLLANNKATQFYSLSPTEVSEGEYDPTYKPTMNKDFVRYNGWRTPSDDGYQTEQLIQKPMLNGEKGTLKWRARGEGYFSGSFFCSLKTN